MKSFLRRRGGPFRESRLLPLGDQPRVGGRRLGPSPKARGQEGQHRRRHLEPHPGQAHQDLGLREGGEEGLDSGFQLDERETQKPNFWVY